MTRAEMRDKLIESYSKGIEQLVAAAKAEEDGDERTRDMEDTMGIVSITLMSPVSVNEFAQKLSEELKEAEHVLKP